MKFGTPARWLCLTAAAVLGLASADAQATVILDQDFDDTSVFTPNTAIDTIGVGDSATVGGHWKGTSDSSSLPPTPKADPDGGAGQAVNILRPSSGAFSSLVGTRSDASISSGAFVYELSVYRPSQFGSVVINIQDSGSLTSTFPIGLYIQQPTGTVAVRNLAGNAWENTSASLSEDVWHDFRAVVDMDAGQWDLYVDDTAVFTDRAFDTNSLSSVNGLMVIPQQSEIYLDNVLIAVPEPASIGLMGAGVLMLVGRRAR